jgi:hypothetical protein
MARMNNPNEEEKSLIGKENVSEFARISALKILENSKSFAGLFPDTEAMRFNRLKRSITTASRLVQDRLVGDKGRNSLYRPAMITLTYAKVEDWQPEHLTKYLDKVRNWLARRGLKFHYVWVAELQKRGAVHYHIIVWLPRGQRLPKPDQSGMWKHGKSQIVWARKPVGYLVKYASKFEENQEFDFPKGIRLHGFGGLKDIEKIEMRYWKAPKYVRDLITEIKDIRKVKGGYEIVNLGWVESPWRLCSIIDGYFFFIKWKRSAEIQFSPLTNEKTVVELIEPKFPLGVDHE